MRSGLYKQSAFHLAGIVPIAGQKLEFGMPWHDALTPVSPGYTALQRSVYECAIAGCETIWIVCHDETQPLVRSVLGEWIIDPTTLRGIRQSDHIRRIPIFYVPIHPKDRDRWDCLGLAALHGAYVAYRTSLKMSKWVIPDKYYITFPYGISDIEIVRASRKQISHKKTFAFSHDGRTVKDGLHLPFTINGDDYLCCTKAVKGASTLSRQGDRVLSKEERYSARRFTLNTVFQHVIMTDVVKEMPWHYEINTWDGYCNFLASDERWLVDKPEHVTYNEWSRTGQDEQARNTED
tara:strand:+ start:289 stop:1167 length:879 start_codon:yes stop_codon:yes gene_type:complete